MIGYLKGIPLQLDPEVALLDVGGVGYSVNISVPTFGEIERAGDGAAVGLFIHTHIREGELSLFGFWTAREKALFELLITVSGIGPRLARVILSGLPADDLIAALSAGDLLRLTAIPGVGKKTAERIVLELRDKARDLGSSDEPVPAGPGDRDVVSALVNLGYKPAAAEKAVIEARREMPESEFHDLLRQSLKRLSRA